jgi:hypothetical protein
MDLHFPGGEVELFSSWRHLDRFCGAGAEGFFQESADKAGGDGSPMGGVRMGAPRDYREEIKMMMAEKEPCVVLLCSPPGAGKSFFSDQLAQTVQNPSRATGC